jgi:hypothetical protein
MVENKYHGAYEAFSGFCVNINTMGQYGFISLVTENDMTDTQFFPDYGFGLKCAIQKQNYFELQCIAISSAL